MMKPGLVVVLVLSSAAAVASCTGDDPVVSAGPHDEAGAPDGGAMTMGDSSLPLDGSASDGASNPDAKRPVPPAKGDFGWLSTVSKGDTNGGVAFDAAGNAFFAFGFYGSIVIDGTHSLTNVDASGNTLDIGLVKVDTAGHVAGAWSFGTPGNDSVNAVAVDAAGDVYLTGNYGSATFAFGGGVTLTKVAGVDPYVLKVHGSDGSPVWAQDFATATTSYALCTHLAFGGGRIAVRCYATADLGVKLTNGTVKSLTPIPNSSSPTGTSHFAELDPATGKAFWATTVGAEGVGGAPAPTLGVIGLAVDSAGGMLFTASSGAVAGDTIHNVSGTLNLTYTGASGAMLVGKLSAANGEGLWLKEYTDGTPSPTNQTAPGGVATDSMNNVIIGGEIRGTVPIGSKTVSSIGPSFDAFIAKLDPAGTTLWTRSFGGAQDEDRPYVAVDPWDQIFAAGSYKSTGVTIDAFPLPDVPAGGAGAYLVKLDGTSKALWAKGTNESGTSSVLVRAVSADPFTGGAAVAGYLGSGSVDLGNGTPVTNGSGATTFFAFDRSP